MQIKKDIESLMNKLEKSVDSNGNQILPGVFREVMNLFEVLKENLPKMNAVERQEVFQNMHNLHQFLQGQIQKLSVRSGLSEEQLLRFSENPDNFSGEQWSLLTEVKEKMQLQSNELKEVMKAIPGPFLAAPDVFLQQTMPAKKTTPMPASKGHRVKREIKRA